MKLMIHLESENGHYVAQVMGYPESRVEAPTCEAALVAVGSTIRKRLDNDEIYLLTFPTTTPAKQAEATPKREIQSIRDVFGFFKDDPTIDELRDSMRWEREEDLKREFSE